MPDSLNIPTLKLIRIAEVGNATLGILNIKDIPEFATLEEPWRNNQREISCIPDGDYDAIRHVSPKFGETWLLKDVPGRSEILLHIGNTTNDTRGCILIGEWFGTIRGKPAVLRSRIAIARLSSILRNQAFRLQIRSIQEALIRQ